MSEKLLTTREVSQFLNLPEKDIIDLANADLLPHFKVAGEFLRFKKEDIFKVKETIRRKYNIPEHRDHIRERVKDFFYFNDFYIVSSLIILSLLWVIFKDFYL